MPYKTRKFNKKRKYVPRGRRYRKRWNRRTTNLVGGSSGPRTGISSRVVTCLKYHTRNNIALSGGIPNDFIFRLNSLFDPEYTLAGHQPLYFDQLAAIYSKYRVFKTSYVIKMIMQSDNANTVETSVIPNNDLASYSNADLAAENPRAIYRQWNSQTPITIRGSQYLPALTGRPSSSYRSDDVYAAAVSQNPVETLGLHIVNISSSTPTITLDVTMKFHCEFFDPLQVGQS